jgi:hypothetical protein
LQQSGQLAACGFDFTQILAAQFDLQRRGEAEDLGPAELDLRRRVALHGFTQGFGFKRGFGVARRAALITTVSLPMFSPDSVGFASSRVPLPLTP